MIDLKLNQRFVFKYFEESSDIFEALEYCLNEKGSLSYQDILFFIEHYSLKNCPYLLSILLLLSNDPAAEHTVKKLFLRWVRKELEIEGTESTFLLISQVLTVEHESIEKKE